MNHDIDIPSGLRELIRSLFPEADISRAELMGPDTSGHGGSEKSAGYGRPIRITVRSPHDGAERAIVFHTALANEFGHDRRSDRAEEMLLAWDTTRGFPRHVEALDIGVALPQGRYRSLREAGEFYLITTYCEGTPYAEDLRRIADSGTHTVHDLKRCEAMVRYLVQLHAARLDNPVAYRRAIRDLIGHGEGAFGIVDAYGPQTPAGPPERLAAIEHRCLDWRWKLRGRESRLRRTHGDFHPFNVIFREGTDFSVLDASRGCLGDPADDLAAMAINYLFFAVERPETWKHGFAPLWSRFWGAYLAGSGDRELLDVVAPFLAWRGLVVACPKFYPNLSAAGRDKILQFVERTLAADWFDPDRAEEVFR